MLFKNAVKASKNLNSIEFSDSKNIVPHWLRKICPLKTRVLPYPNKIWLKSWKKRKKTASSPSRQLFNHDYECSRLENQRESAYTQFVSKGRLTMLSTSAFSAVKYAEIVFKACVCKDGRQIRSSDGLRSKMIVEVINRFFVDKSRRSTVSFDQDPELNDVNDGSDLCSEDEKATQRRFPFNVMYIQF